MMPANLRFSEGAALFLAALGITFGGLLLWAAITL